MRGKADQWALTAAGQREAGGGTESGEDTEGRKWLVRWRSGQGCSPPGLTAPEPHGREETRVPRVVLGLLPCVLRHMCPHQV